MKFAVEIADEANRSVIFQPTSERLRGRWDGKNCIGKRMHEFLAKMPHVIPGIMLIVDTNARTCTRLDPLGLKENEKILTQINGAYKSHPTPPDGDQGAWETVTQPKCSDDMMKTWLFWMRRLVDAKHAEMVPGYEELPTEEDFDKLPGKAFIGQFNSMKTRNFAFNEDEATDAINKVRSGAFGDE